MEEYNKAVQEWEQYEQDQEEAEEKNIDAMFKMGLNAKQTKKRRMAPKRPDKFNKIPKSLLKRTTAAPKPTQTKKDIDESKLLEETKFIDVDETRDPASLIFIGHVDAGKSTICGQLMLLTGMVDERTIKQYEKEAKDKGRDSWWLAYVMDINEEEKEKGKTVEVGRTTLETTRKRYTIFDAPGHKNYVPNMIMGAAAADFACLVISARKGEYEAGFERCGQT